MLMSILVMPYGGPFLLLYAPPRDTLFSILKKCHVKVVVWTGIQDLQVSLGGPLISFFLFYLSIFTGSLIYEHYTRECQFGNFDKIKNKKHKKTKQHKKTQKLLAEFLFK